jgi:hypothetical protein
MVLAVYSDHFLKQHKPMVSVIGKCCGLFVVPTEYLNII